MRRPPTVEVGATSRPPRAQRDRLDPTDIPVAIARTTVADAGQVREWRIWQEFAEAVIRIAHPLHIDKGLGLELDFRVYALDFSTINLNLHAFRGPASDLPKEPSAVGTRSG